ncbi:hypothetical protein P7C70_g9098, partial [Phenoliferia sp. Uapishka_3]
SAPNTQNQRNNSKMAAHQAVRQLTLQERFQLQAPFLPTITLTNLFKPDRSNFDLVANTSTTNNGLRALPSSLERSPRWSLDAICPASIVRSFCEYGAKLVAIPAGHPALEQYEEGLIGYMVEGGAKMDIHGKGEATVNLYAFAEDKWNHPRLQADFQTPDFQGYISERLVETSVDGMGRLRALGLARLQEIAREKGGLGEIGRQLITNTSPIGPLTTSRASTSITTPSTLGGTTPASPSAPSPKTSPPLPPLNLPPSPTRTNETATASPTVSPTGTRPLPTSTSSPTSTEETGAGSAGVPGARQSKTGPTRGDEGGQEVSARAQAAARLKQIAAHIEKRHATTSKASNHQTELEGNAVERIATTGTSGTPSSNATDSSTLATSGSRKRKATSPRLNLRAETEDLFNKNQKQRQTHDWRAENGPGGRTANDWRGQASPRTAPYPSTPSRSTPQPPRENHYPSTPTQQHLNLPPRPSNDTVYHQHH